MIGKKILVGLRYLNKDGSVKDKIQFYGSIESVNNNTLTIKRADNGQLFSIPYSGENEVQKTDPKLVYTLHETGEKVSGVNYISVFTIHENPLKNG